MSRVWVGICPECGKLFEGSTPATVKDKSTMEEWNRLIDEGKTPAEIEAIFKGRMKGEENEQTRTED